MKFTNTLRLEFEHVFPDENQNELIEYLKLVSKESLLNLAGFTNTYPQPNFDTFFSNINLSEDILKRVNIYCYQNDIEEKPQLVSREGSLKIAEIILSNRDTLIDENSNDTGNVDADEINLFKSFLITNKVINKKQKLTTSNDLENREKLAQMIISMSFSTSDLGLLKDDIFEFGKLVYCAIERFEILIKFLNSDPQYYYLIKTLYLYFNAKSLDDLKNHIKYLFAKLLELKTNNSFKFNVGDEDSQLFLNSLISQKIEIDDDFTNLRKYPLYKLTDNIYSVIDYFFIVDKFYKSVRFVLKEAFNKEHGLSENDRTFFDFFNTKFSEEFLMKDVLDKLFNKTYFVKKIEGLQLPNEPDYYVRHNRNIFLFESKDVLIAKAIKSSGDIDQILKVLNDKFFDNKGKPIGIGQLITSICQIVENQFDYDKYVNNKKNFTIFPILLVNDRILEIPGINYILNQWYLRSIKEKLKEKYNPSFIRDLTIIDIDTLMFGLHYFIKSDNNFKNYIENHLKEQKTEKKPIGNTSKEILESAKANLMKQFSPISLRFDPNEFPQDLFIEKFKDLIK